MTRAAVRVALAVATVTGLVSACENAVSSPRGPAQSGASRSTRTLPGAAAMERYLAGLTAAGRFSGTVLVARGGHVLLRNGYGLADRATRMPNGPGTVFQIGSVTKQFTAMAIVMLAAQGRLRLTGRACAYVPDCPRSWRPITITELLTHTSGIANWSTWHFTKLPVVHADPIANTVELAELVPLAFQPGTRASYSNPGYVVLGDIVEHVSGMSYGNFLRSNIFVPLGMTHTGLYQGQRIGPGHALGYLASGAVAPTVLTAESTAAGAMYSTVGDLYRWDQALISGTPRLVPAALLRQILTVHAPCPYASCPLPGDRGYGYGWFVGGGPDGKVVHHSGSVLGFWSYNGFYPARDTVVVILSNLDTVQINPISAELNGLAQARRSPWLAQRADPGRGPLAPLALLRRLARSVAGPDKAAEPGALF